MCVFFFFFSFCGGRTKMPLICIADDELTELNRGPMFSISLAFKKKGQ